MPRNKAELSPATASLQLQRQAVPRINAAPVQPADSPHTPQSTNLQPITPSKRRRQRAESDDDYEPETPSPTKRIKTPRGAPLTPSSTPAGPLPQTPGSGLATPSRALRTPSRAARTPSQKALRAAEKEWKPDWYALVARNIWIFNRNFRHPDDTKTIYLGEAMEQFPIKRGELDILPYKSFSNPHNRSCPMRSYNIETVRQMACPKHAMLAGLHKKRLSEAEMISRGEELWKAAKLKRDQRRANRRFRRVMPTPSTGRGGPKPLVTNECTYKFDDFVVYAGEPRDLSNLENEAAEDDDDTASQTWDNCDDCVLCQFMYA